MPAARTLTEVPMARALDAIRQCARIAWWDGSAVGLRLAGLLGLLDPNPGDQAVRASRREEPL